MDIETNLFIPSDLIDYQEGGVVSRVVLKNPSGSVTLFAFDKDESLSEHTAPFDALVYVLEGEAGIRVGGKEHSVAEGRMIKMPANVPHALHAIERFKMLLVMLRAGK